MASYYIHMDQGLMADLRNHTLCSGQFSSCAPIVFYNEKDHVGGLYHLGGCDKLNAMKTEDLRSMVTLVGPTVAYVLQGAGSFDMRTGTNAPSQGHVAPVCALLQQINAKLKVHDNFDGQRAFHSITVRELNGALKVTQGCSLDNPLKTKKVIDELDPDLAFIGESRDEKLAIWA